jgi:tRNA1Val (adenine37-N6)-methyltransferase
MKVINTLFGNEKLQIVQDTQMFKFSLDSVLLPHFIDYSVQYKRILDIGTGNAPIPIIMSQNTSAKIDAIEVQKSAFLLAKESIELNGLCDQIDVINDNVIDWYRHIETDTYDLIVCNPPYFKNVNKSNNESKTIAKHEGDLTIEILMKIAKKILKNKGRIALVHRTERLMNIIVAMKNNNIEPKRIQLIYPKLGKNSNIILIEGVKNGNESLKILDPIYVHSENGEYTEQILKYLE